MFGYIVLFGWPVVVAILFKTCTKPVALLASLLAGYLLLPTQLFYDVPILPRLDKDTIPVISAFVALLILDSTKSAKELPGWIPQNATSKILLFGLIAGTFFTVMTNGDPLSYGITNLPGLRPFDAFSEILRALVILLPFFLARKFLAHPDQQKTVLMALTISGALYAFLALYEVRMSPQLNNIIYGFFPHSWSQHVRGDGFRPIVFLIHGLWLSIFFSISCLAAFGLMKSAPKEQRIWFFCLGMWMLFALVMSKSLGALMITLLLLVILILPRRSQLLVAAITSAIVLMYPMLRGAEIIPVDQILAWAESFSPDRAQSFGVRVYNEDILLEKAQQRPLFGWGIWGRSLIYSEYGQNISVTDGYWVIVVGVGGWVKYLAEFGLLCLPVIFAALRQKTYQLGPETAVLILILTASLIDLIPNATITPITWMIAGAVWGRVELGAIDQAEHSEDVPESPRRVVYSRFPKGTAPQAPQAKTAPPTPSQTLSFSRRSYGEESL